MPPAAREQLEEAKRNCRVNTVSDEINDAKPEIAEGMQFPMPTDTIPDRIPYRISDRIPDRKPKCKSCCRN